MHITQRIKRRTLGMLRKRLDEVGLHRLSDPRGRHNRRWSLPTLLRTLMLSMASGARNLHDVERLSYEFSSGARTFARSANRRVPDTTLRDVLCKLDANELRPLLHRAVKAAYRRKAVHHDLPIGVLVSGRQGDGDCLS